MERTAWAANARRFFDALYRAESASYASVLRGTGTLYGTCYGLLARYYLGENEGVPAGTVRFIQECQDARTGLLVGPEVRDRELTASSTHDREHVLLHLTCTALATCQQFGITLAHPVRAAHQFCDLDTLREWLEQRSLARAWYEGNNFLFVGQLLVYLRDVERHPGAAEALGVWFKWLDDHVDPATGLWGSDGYCSAMEALYGGYHQLLVYYYEGRPLINTRGLVDTALSLQHPDGGFNPGGNGGACEDVDCVDILVNCYKRLDYRRPEVRVALRNCMRHILATQNADGGFPYNRGNRQSHLGLPATEAPADVSCAFPTWFRVHTLALIAEVLPEEPALRGLALRFSKALSMGWHADPDTWHGASSSRSAEVIPVLRQHVRRARHQGGRMYRAVRHAVGRLVPQQFRRRRR